MGVSDCSVVRGGRWLLCPGFAKCGGDCTSMSWGIGDKSGG